MQKKKRERHTTNITLNKKDGALIFKNDGGVQILLPQSSENFSDTHTTNLLIMLAINSLFESNDELFTSLIKKTIDGIIEDMDKKEEVEEVIEK